MAIDTAAKRASAAGFGWIQIHIIPQGSSTAASRQTIAGLYGGITAGSAPVWAGQYHWNSPYSRVID